MDYYWPCLLAPMSKTVVLEIKPGDCVAVQPPHQRPWLGQVLYVEAGSRMTDRNFAPVIRHDHHAVNAAESAGVRSCEAIQAHGRAEEG